jgi:hypothetical protein
MPPTGRMKDWPTTAILWLWLAAAYGALALVYLWLGVRSHDTARVVLGVLWVMTAAMWVLLAFKRRRTGPPG